MTINWTILELPDLHLDLYLQDGEINRISTLYPNIRFALGVLNDDN